MTLKIEGDKFLGKPLLKCPGIVGIRIPNLQIPIRIRGALLAYLHLLLVP